MIENMFWRYGCGLIIAVAMVVPASAAGAGSGVSGGGGPVDLRPHWHTGQESTYEFKTQRQQEQTMSMDGHTRSAHTTIQVAGEVVWKVDHVNSDGGSTCTMTRKWMSATLIGPKGQKKVNDTRSGQADVKPLYEVLKALTSSPVTVQVAADGSVEHVTGISAIKQQVKVKELVPSAKSMARFADMLAPIANAPASAKIGDTWQSRYSLPAKMGTVDHQVQYRLKSLESIAGIQVATIESTGALQLQFDRSKIPADAPPIDVHMENGESKSQIIYDFSRHEAVGRNLSSKQTIVVTIHIPKHTLHQETTQAVSSEILRMKVDE